MPRLRHALPRNVARWVGLTPSEIGRARKIGVDVVESPSGLAWYFHALVSMVTVARFTSSAQRIAGYRCGLLQRYQSGDVSLDEALDVIKEAKSLAGKLTAEIGNVDFPQLRNRWRLGLEAFQSGDASAERDQLAYLHLSVLCLFLDRHIAAPGEAQMMKKDS